MDNRKENIFIGSLLNKFPPDKIWFSPKEAADVLGVSDQFVRNAYDSGKLQGTRSNASVTRGKESKQYTRIHKASLIQFVLQNSNFDADDFAVGMKLIMDSCTNFQLFTLEKLLKNRLNGNPNSYNRK